MKNKQKTLKITNKVMKDIESGRLRMKKKEWFILKKILIVMSTVFILSGISIKKLEHVPQYILPQLRQ